jgi:hypothetical protein
MTSIGPKAQGKSINRAALTESLLRSLLGIAALTPTYVIRSGFLRRQALGVANGHSASPGNGLHAGKKKVLHGFPGKAALIFLKKYSLSR